MRFACRNCREAYVYAFQLVLDKVPAEVQTVESVEDVLHGEIFFMKSVGHCGDFAPSFYTIAAMSGEVCTSSLPTLECFEGTADYRASSLHS
mmetsp:Transcript_2912/g.5372  ORF Transcript_2912/g.5372 Transcript_2912/m.5372 type:complete len:92 (+) Transcript_2912:648-923(+)